jgi:hypothetical protein
MPEQPQPEDAVSSTGEDTALDLVYKIEGAVAGFDGSDKQRTFSTSSADRFWKLMATIG